MQTFPRGIHLEDNKNKTKNKAIEAANIPSKIILPLLQNLGCPCEPIVKVGDIVTAGQKIADSSKQISAPIHSSIAGKVTRVENDLIVIEGQGEESRQPKAESRAQENSREEIINKIHDAGIVGLGGAGFPTHVKLTPPPGKKIDTIIINGCECEPFITADHRLMLERTDDIIFGAQIIAKAVGASRIIFAIEENKRDAIEKMKVESRKLKVEIRIEVVLLKTKYPQGGERQVIKAVTGKEVPSGGLPADIGVIVDNVATAVAIAEAIKYGKPLTEKVITVTGSGIKEPKNLLVKLGTPIEDVINQCGGLTENAAKIIMGGPMMGIALSSLTVPIVKQTNCILVMTKEEVKNYEEQGCIRCGRCIKACPAGLMPNFLCEFSKLKNWEKLEEHALADCIECGCCSYVCPSRIYLVQYFKTAKYEMRIRKTVCK